MSNGVVSLRPSPCPWPLRRVRSSLDWPAVCMRMPLESSAAVRAMPEFLSKLLVTSLSAVLDVPSLTHPLLLRIFKAQNIAKSITGWQQVSIRAA